MIDIDIACPNCSEKLVLDHETAGRQVVCPYCDALVSMPAFPDTPEALAALAAKANEKARAAAPKASAPPPGRTPTQPVSAEKPSPKPAEAPSQPAAPKAPPSQPAPPSNRAPAAAAPAAERRGGIPAPRAAGEKPRAQASETGVAIVGPGTAAPAPVTLGLKPSLPSARQDNLRKESPRPAPAAPVEPAPAPVQAAPAPPARKAPAPLPKTGNAPAPSAKKPVEAEPPAPPREPTALPAARMRPDPARTAAPMAVNQAGEVKTGAFDSRGLHGFACPSCGRQMAVKQKEAGHLFTCDGCHAEIQAPDPEKGALARVTKAAPPVEHRPKTVLPAARHADRPVAEVIPAAPDALAERPKADLPAPRKVGEAPKLAPPPQWDEQPEPEAQPPAPSELDEMPEDESDATAAKAPVGGNFRLGENRRLILREKEDGEDLEASANWGTDLDPAELRRRKNRRLIVWGTVICLPLVLAVVWYALSRGVYSAVPPPDESLTGGEGPGARAMAEKKNAIDAVKAFLSAETQDAMAALVRHPEATTPRMAEWYTKARPYRPVKVRNFDDKVASVSIDDVPFILVSAELSDFSRVSLAVEAPEKGPFKVDWESYVNYADMTLSDFLARQPLEPHEFRVTCQVENYYAYHYSSDQQFFCFKLVDAQNVNTCWGYTGLDSTTGEKIHRIIRRQSRNQAEKVKLILKLRFEPAGKGHDQVWIDDVVQDGWVKVNP